MLSLYYSLMFMGFIVITSLSFMILVNCIYNMSPLPTGNMFKTMSGRLKLWIFSQNINYISLILLVIALKFQYTFLNNLNLSSDKTAQFMYSMGTLSHSTCNTGPLLTQHFSFSLSFSITILSIISFFSMLYNPIY